MTKRWFKALEKVFAAEIDDRLPFQSNAMVYRELAQAGMVDRCERTFGSTLPVVCRGWELTHKGRLEYCAQCDLEVPD